MPDAQMGSAATVTERIRESLPAHYFDCERFDVTDYGTRQGKCDCTATADIESLLDGVERPYGTRYTVRVSVGDLVIFDGSVTDKDFFRMEQKEDQSTRVNLSATAAIEGLTR